MTTPMKLGRIHWHRPSRGPDQRPRGAYLTIFVGKSDTARFVQLSIEDLLQLSEDAAKSARFLLAEGEG